MAGVSKSRVTPGETNLWERKSWRQMETLFALADQLEERLAKARGQVEKLTPSLPPPHCYGGTGLARAFAGQLVPQDPTDEPAAELLTRIQGQKTNQTH